MFGSQAHKFGKGSISIAWIHVNTKLLKKITLLSINKIGIPNSKVGDERLTLVLETGMKLTLQN